MLHHERNYLASVHEDRLRRATRRRLPADARDIERAMTAAEHGDPRAWAGIVDRFQGHITRIARSYGLASHEVDDVVQETWLRLYRNIGSVRDPQALGAWLGTTARRESLRVIAGARREPPTDAEPFAEVTDADDLPEELVRAERRKDLQRALATLQPRHRTLMETLLRDPEPTYAEVSQTLSIPIGSIGPIRARCVARLRRELHAA
jgi:RNA polymerase sigma factor (sigma-70 family)